VRKLGRKKNAGGGGVEEGAPVLGLLGAVGAVEVEVGVEVEVAGALPGRQLIIGLLSNVSRVE